MKRIYFMRWHIKDITREYRKCRKEAMAMEEDKIPWDDERYSYLNTRYAGLDELMDYKDLVVTLLPSNLYALAKTCSPAAKEGGKQ